MNDISIIIPTCNMAQDLKLNLDAIFRYRFLNNFRELIVVDDASTDETSRVLSLYSDIKVIKLEKNVGRYEARKLGALSAQGKFLLFLDTRLEVGEEFCDHIAELISKYSIVQGTIEIPVEESIFNLYWDRSHRFLFKDHFKHQKRGFFLTQENYEKYTSGTTIFLVKKDIFLETLSDFKVAPISDDREVIRKLVAKQEIWVTEDLKVKWRPRQSLPDYLKRLIERGPTFVDYHFYQQKTKFAISVYLGLVVMILNLLLLLNSSVLFFRTLFVELAFMALSVIIFTRSPVEILKLMGLHLLVIFSFGIGVLKGLITENPWIKARKGGE